MIEKEISENLVGQMTVREAGRIGGTNLYKNRGREHFSKIGSMGRRVQMEKPGYNDSMKERGRLGGLKNMEKNGRDDLKVRGKRGGETLKAEKKITDPDYWSRIGKISANAKKARLLESKAK